MNNILYDPRKYIKPTKDDWNNILFELTNYCNLNCPFCFNGSSAEKKEYMTLNQFTKMVDKVKHKASFVQLSGGEPLANPEFQSIIEYLISHGVAFHVNTNGTLVTEWLLDILLQYQNASIQFSLDGATAHVDNQIRCKGHFEKVISHLDYLKHNNFRRGALKMVINRINYSEIEQNFMLAIQYGFLPTYSFVIRSGRADDNWAELSLGDRERYEARNLIWKLIDENITYFDRYDNPNLLFYLRNMNINYGGECQFNLEFCNFTPYVHVNGDVQPCQGLVEAEYCIGNLLEEEPSKIFTHDNELVKLFSEKAKRRRNILDSESCASCALNKTCGKGCILESINAGSFYAPPSDCYIRKRDFIHSILEERQ